MGEYSKWRKRGRDDEDLGLSAWINTKRTTSLKQSPNGLSENHTCSSSSSCGVGDIYARMLREQQELDLFILVHVRFYLLLQFLNY